MVYNIKEYNTIFDTPLKKKLEKRIVQKIMDLLNKNKYDNLEEFIKKNNSYQEFLNNIKEDNVAKHFDKLFNENDYQMVLNRLRILTNNKQSTDEKNIKTTTIDDSEYVSFQGQFQPYFFDNSNSKKTIHEEIRHMQPTQKQFQTEDPRQNTENIFKELEKTKKESLNLVYLNDIDVNNLNFDQKQLFNTAILQQYENQQRLRIDLEKQVIVDEENNIMKIEKENGVFVIKKENGIENKEKTNQKQITLKPNINSTYNNAA